MSPAFEPDLAEERHQNEAEIQMLRVGLALIDDARHGQAFETDPEKLAARVDEILTAFAGENPGSAAVRVTATTEDGDRVLLSAETGRGSATSALLGVDGILLEEFNSIGFSAEAVDPVELSPEEQEELQKVQERFKAAMEVPQFRGERFIRALATNLQPESDMQILVVELFEDGLIVHYSFDENPESSESTGPGTLPMGFGGKTGIRVEDDLGTEYRCQGGGESGVQVMHGALSFSPCVPSGATTLRVLSGSGMVELAL